MANKELQFNPTTDQEFELEGGGKYNFVRSKSVVDRLVSQGRYDEACEARYEAFLALAEALPEDEAMPLSWNHANSRAAVSILYGSAVDHFRIGDLEMAMAQLELLLDCDPEDHFEGVNLLALCYVAMQEWEAFEELTIDLTDKSAEAVVARLWASFVRDGALDSSLVKLLRSRHKAYYEELLLEEHPDDETFRREISSERPTPRAEAREWWLLTEPLWREFPDFCQALRLS
ncbi:MAG: tetratricopeptide repeat protein [Alistipes sp.]|nr:tetratricopeptide repeat protein [Alistipes sp.]